MIYFILVFGTVIIGTLAFIVSIGKWFDKDLINLYHYFNYMSRTQRIVERRYNAVDLYAAVKYIKIEDFKGIFRVPDTNILVDNKHKQYLIEQQCRLLAKKMLDDGLIEIWEEDDYQFHPDMKRIMLKVKVYKRDN